MQTLSHSLTLRLSLFLLLILPFSLTFYTQLTPTQNNKCYLGSTFPNQNLLVHLKVPTINDPIQITVQAYLKGKKIFLKILRKSQDKITIKISQQGQRQGYAKPTEMQQAEICIKTTISSQNPTQIQRISKNRYLVWLTIHNNFIKHVQNAQSIPSSSSQPYQQQQDNSQLQQNSTDILKQLTIKIQRMNQTFHGQVLKFHHHYQTDQNNQKKLMEIVQDMFNMAVIQVAVIGVVVVGYVGFFAKFLC